MKHDFNRKEARWTLKKVFNKGPYRLRFDSIATEAFDTIEEALRAAEDAHGVESWVEVDMRIPDIETRWQGAAFRFDHVAFDGVLPDFAIGKNDEVEWYVKLWNYGGEPSYHFEKLIFPLPGTDGWERAFFISESKRYRTTASRLVQRVLKEAHGGPL